MSDGSTSTKARVRKSPANDDTQVRVYSALWSMPPNIGSGTLSSVTPRVRYPRRTEPDPTALIATNSDSVTAIPRLGA
jgi:hypothetical protein